MENKQVYNTAPWLPHHFLTWARAPVYLDCGLWCGILSEISNFPTSCFRSWFSFTAKETPTTKNSENISRDAQELRMESILKYIYPLRNRLLEQLFTQPKDSTVVDQRHLQGLPCSTSLSSVSWVPPRDANLAGQDIERQPNEGRNSLSLFVPTLYLKEKISDLKFSRGKVPGSVAEKCHGALGVLDQVSSSIWPSGVALSHFYVCFYTHSRQRSQNTSDQQL